LISEKTLQAAAGSGSISANSKVVHPEVMPTLGSEKTRYYRNKPRFTFSNKKWLTLDQSIPMRNFDRNALGFHIPKMFDKKSWM